MQNHDVDTLLELAIREDFDEIGDITCEAIFSGEDCRALLIGKTHGVLAGKDVFSRVFTYVDKHTRVAFHHDDGRIITPGLTLALVEGKAQSVLSAERTALNFIGFLSGIATQTHAAVKTALDGGKAVILDTRKTLPGFRKLSKYAVKTGGGVNHRMGLYDMILIKDNHIDAVGGIAEAVRRVRKKWGSRYKIEVECRSLHEVREALDAHVDIIMLDNMDADVIKQSVLLKEGGVRFEASGNMDMQKINDISRLGVDYISVGMLTHSVRSVDFSLKIEVKGTTKRKP
jgi:nicotinate-nucleotide pyrophosphorylase (carboxylating)